jgi:hypothetical protein
MILSGSTNSVRKSYLRIPHSTYKASTDDPLMGTDIVVVPKPCLPSHRNHTYWVH